jgi:hypothetical protein
MKKPKFDLNTYFTPIVKTFSKKELKKRRNFPGAWTTGGYGPVNAPMVTNGGDTGAGGTFGGFTTGYGAGDPVSLGESENINNFSDNINYDKTDSNGVIMDKRVEKFMAFLESLKNDENKTTIETVKTGFEACLEAAKKWSGKVTKEVKKSEKPEAGTFTKKSGAIVSELMDKAEGNPGTAVKKINFYANRAGDKLANKAEVMKAKNILEKKNEKEAKKD